MENMENMENIIVLTDENGEEMQFELITALEVDNREYFVLYPVDSEEDDAMVLRLDVNEDGEETLAQIEDDEEFAKVEEAYEKWLEEDDEE